MHDAPIWIEITTQSYSPHSSNYTTRFAKCLLDHGWPSFQQIFQIRFSPRQVYTKRPPKDLSKNFYRGFERRLKVDCKLIVTPVLCNLLWLGQRADQGTKKRHPRQWLHEVKKNIPRRLRYQLTVSFTFRLRRILIVPQLALLANCSLKFPPTSSRYGISEPPPSRRRRPEAVVWHSWSCAVPDRNDAMLRISWMSIRTKLCHLIVGIISCEWIVIKKNGWLDTLQVTI